MSWAGFGAALRGGLGAFQEAREDQLRRTQLDLQNQRYTEEQAYRQSRDGVEDSRYAEERERQARLDAERLRDTQRARALQGFELSQQHGSAVAPEQAALLREEGLGGGLGERQTLAPLEGFGAAAQAIAGGGIQAESATPETYARKTFEQEMAERGAAYKLKDLDRDEAYFAELDAAQGNPAKMYAVALKFGKAMPDNPEESELRRRQVEAGIAASAAAAGARNDARLDRKTYNDQLLEERKRARIDMMVREQQDNAARMNQIMAPEAIIQFRNELLKANGLTPEVVDVALPGSGATGPDPLDAFFASKTPSPANLRR